MKAWLITWEWSGDHAAVDEPLITILSARLGDDDVRKFIERYYVACFASPCEKIRYARYNKPDRMPYSAKRSKGQITCGHNPFIRGRLVESLKVVGDERLTWVENGRTKSLGLADPDTTTFGCPRTTPIISADDTVTDQLNAVYDGDDSGSVLDQRLEALQFLSLPGDDWQG